MIPNTFWIVVTQWDSKPDGFHGEFGPPKGPMVWENMCLTFEEAKAQAVSFGDKYGWTHVMKVVSNAGRQEQWNK